MGQVRPIVRTLSAWKGTGLEISGNEAAEFVKAPSGSERSASRSVRIASKAAPLKS